MGMGNVGAGTAAVIVPTALASSFRLQFIDQLG